MWNVRGTTEMLTFTYAVPDQQSMLTTYPYVLYHLHESFEKCFTLFMARLANYQMLFCYAQTRSGTFFGRLLRSPFFSVCYAIFFILPRLKRVSMPDICWVGWYLLIWALLLVNMTDTNMWWFRSKRLSFCPGKTFCLHLDNSQSFHQKRKSNWQW